MPRFPLPALRAAFSLPALALAALFGALLPSAVEAAAPPAPGQVFKDCRDCPEMVVLPSGSFIMGTPDDEVGRQPDEGPMHEVTFSKPFALSRFTVTAGEWAVYLRESGYTMPDGDARPGRECIAGKPRYPMSPRQPAVCLTWHEAQSYIAWLSKKTGKAYRMPSESVREYAARAGSKGPFPFPFDEGKEYSIAKHANTYGPEDGFSYTAPVGSFPPNAFGLYDMHGNVYEWLADILHENYVGAPTDGSAWTDPPNPDDDCDYRAMRGNDWTEAPIFSRSGNRNDRCSKTAGDWLGFRVMRDL